MDPTPPPAASDPSKEAESLKAEAIAAAERAAAAYPDDGLTHALLGAAFYNMGRSSEAEKHLRRCLELRPQQADAYEILARIAYERGDPELAVRHGSEALRRGATSPEVVNQLGRALMDLGRAAEAADLLERAAASRNASGETLYLLGQARMQCGDFARAVEALEKAIGITPDHTQAAYALFTAHARLGHADLAARYRERFEFLESHDRAALIERNAREESLEGLALVRESTARTLFGASQIHRLHGNRQQAVELLRRCAELAPGNGIYAAALRSIAAAPPRNAGTP